MHVEDTFIFCNFTHHAQSIREIFNEVILHSTALYEYQPRTLGDIKKWFAIKSAEQFPVLGIVDATGKLMAFGTYGSFRHFPAYLHTVEHSVYVHHLFRGKGLGRKMLGELILWAQADGYHTMIGAIDKDNLASVALHRKKGFQHSGTLAQVGCKFGKWLDLELYQLMLDPPMPEIQITQEYVKILVTQTV